MEPATEVYFFLDPEISRHRLEEVVFNTFSSDELIKFDSELSGHHEIFGRFLIESIRSSEVVGSFCLLIGCHILPELADIPEDKPKESAQAGYDFARRLFLALDAESCWGAVPDDQCNPFDREDPCLGRVFRFTRSGPQKLVRHYEENRTIGPGEMGLDLEKGRPKWEMHQKGSLLPH